MLASLPLPAFSRAGEGRPLAVHPSPGRPAGRAYHVALPYLTPDAVEREPDNIRRARQVSRSFLPANDHRFPALPAA